MGSSPATAAVEVTGLTHAYGQRRALDAIDLRVDVGTLFAMLGPNGSGKSTLFRLLSTLVAPQQGTIRILGHDLSRERTAVRRQLGVVFQSPALDPKLTVSENLRHHGHLYGLGGRALATRIDTLLQRFGVADRAGSRVETLSGGLRRRVELAKSLLHEPRILILDEPSTGLDPLARRDLLRLLLEIRDRDGVTILLTTHLLDEADRCDRVAILDAGKLVADDTPAALEAKIGGDVITLAARDAAALAADIAARFDVHASVLNGSVRIEHRDARDLMGRILAAFASEIQAATLSRPTLEDVFIHCTGRLFDAPDGAVMTAAAPGPGPEVRSAV
jgi:ABC-2 type transport system ATP-binding protein